MDLSTLPRGKRRLAMASIGLATIPLTAALAAGGLVFGAGLVGMDVNFTIPFMASMAVIVIGSPIAWLHPEIFGRIMGGEFGEQLPGAMAELRNQWNRLP